MKVDGVIIGESRITENGLGSKLGKTRGNIECVDGLLKATTLRIGVELVCNGLISGKRVTLVDQRHGHSVAKWPGEEIIILRLHQHNEERDVCTLASSVTVEVCPEAETVTMGAGIEWRTVEGDRRPILASR